VKKKKRTEKNLVQVVKKKVQREKCGRGNKNPRRRKQTNNARSVIEREGGASLFAEQRRGKR
jgi:hypothetical protein